jgi:hypothetical protein
MNEITDKTVVMVTRNLGNIWLRPDQAEMVKQGLLNEVKFVTLDNDLIMLNDIVGLKSGESIRELEYEKKGGWKCKHGHWHSYRQECGHGLL